MDLTLNLMFGDYGVLVYHERSFSSFFNLPLFYQHRSFHDGQFRRKISRRKVEGYQDKYQDYNFKLRPIQLYKKSTRESTIEITDLTITLIP